MPLYDTTRLLQLRAAVTERRPIEGSLQLACIDRLAELRAAAPAALRDQPAFVGLCWAVWVQLATLDEYSNPFALPPPYRSRAMEREMAWAAAGLKALELGRKSVGEHAIYSGVRGVGKTTWLQVVGALSAVLLQHVLPIYWSYEDGSASAPCVGALMHAAYMVARSPGCGMLFQDALAAAGRPSGEDGLRSIGGSYPLLLLDEFTELYHSDDGRIVQPAREEGKAIMRDMHTLCKRQGNILVLLAASKVQVQRYVHPEGVASLHGYPNLNDSVFKAHEVAPVRTAHELQAYASCRYPGRVFNGAMLLDSTGGIGRAVANCVEFEGSMQLLFDANRITRDPDLFTLFCCILSLQSQDTLRAPAPWGIMGMPRTDALEVLMTRGRSAAEAVNAIDQWRDEGALYECNGMLEVLVPATARQVHEMIAASNDLTAARVLAWTVHGFRGGGPGHSNENFLCLYVHSHVNVSRTTKRTLILDGTATTSDGDTAPAPVHLDELLDCVMKWRCRGSETGIDRVWFVDDAAAAGTRRIVVNGLQMKTGKASRVMTVGVLATQRGMPTARIDDNTIAGVLVKAERGFAKLATALRGCFPTVTWSLGQLRVYTTKPAARGVDAFCAENSEEAGEFHMHGDLASPEASAFAWVVYDGMDWVKEIVPPAVAALL